MNQDHPASSKDSDPLDVAAWQLRYESNQIGWDRGAPSPALMHWLASDELQPCHVVVPGCGYGHEVLELAQRGFRVTAIDFAERPIRSLKERLARKGLTAAVHQSDLFRTQLAESADVVYEQTCLCAIAPAHRGQYVRQLGRWLGPGGRLLAAFMQCEQQAGGHTAIPL